VDERCAETQRVYIRYIRFSPDKSAEARPSCRLNKAFCLLADCGGTTVEESQRGGIIAVIVGKTKPLLKLSR
jgi:hypothetical protein